MKAKNLPLVGRARGVLVSHATGEPTAIVADVSARVLSRECSPSVDIVGPVQFEPATHRHVQDCVLAAVGQVTHILGLGEHSFELSLVNPAAASVLNLGTTVEGYSADAASALAMISAAAQLPVRQDVVSTGHVASTAGDIRPVRSLPQKLRAACALHDIREFVCPSLEEDSSLGVLAPALLQEARDAMAVASRQIRVTPIRNLAELLCAATTEEGRVRGALAAGYFHRGGPDPNGAAAALVSGLEESFWRCLESHLNQGRLSEARRLLKLRLCAELERHQYPGGLGCQLMAVVRSVPPATRRRRGFFPLLPPKSCFEIGCLARVSDQHDASQLLCAAIGQLGDGRSPDREHPKPPVTPTSAAASLAAVLDAISAERLACEIGIPADEARAAFALPGVIIEDYDLFQDTVTAFHLALLRRTDPSNPPAQPDEALDLLERAFADAGGLAAARAEAKFAVGGGMRRVLDQMTVQYKTEQRYKRVNRVLKEWLDPLDWDRQLELMRALLERLRCHLPDELKDADPARFVRRREEIVRAYVYGMDRIGNLIRTM